MIGYKEGEKIGRVRRFISRYCTIVFLRIILFCSGMVWISYERPVVDWRNLLGSDFKPVYEGNSTVIMNHSSWMDIMTMLWWSLPSFLTQNYVKQMPLVG